MSTPQAPGAPPAINAGQERQNRKILEDLQQEKKRLRMMQGQPNSFSSGLGSGPMQRPVPVKDQPGQITLRDPTEAHHLAMSQRTALQHAHSNSVAYFITQDSSFGNLILPVIPRIPPDA
ncbi:SOSS complex subunit C-like [Ptychodera flava]|uniref:SOSS complex subunit C-like n=1 Tax=Ptychodera flava TaxID=63121 RepID=UPI003969FF85